MAKRLTPQEKFVRLLKNESAKFMRKQERQARAKRVQYNGLTNDDFYYTDESKYAEQYYGDRYRQTTGLDNDWG